MTKRFSLLFVFTFVLFGSRTCAQINWPWVCLTMEGQNLSHHNTQLQAQLFWDVDSSWQAGFGYLISSHNYKDSRDWSFYPLFSRSEWSLYVNHGKSLSKKWFWVNAAEIGWGRFHSSSYQGRGRILPNPVRNYIMASLWSGLRWKPFGWAAIRLESGVKVHSPKGWSPDTRYVNLHARFALEFKLPKTSSKPR